MSKLGETADRILEQLKSGQKLSLKELEQKVSLDEIATLYFMSECGLIELEDDELKITELGSELLTLK